MGLHLDGKPHALVVPFPVQGHIGPLMQLARKLASDGFLVTFVNTEYNHFRLMKSQNEASSDQGKKAPDQDEYMHGVRMVSIDDGLPGDVSHDDIPKLLLSFKDTLPSSLHTLIDHINQTEPHKVTCLVLDVSLYHVRHVAQHYDLSYAYFFTSSVASGAISCLGSSLVSSGIVHPNGTPKVDKMVKAYPLMAPVHCTQLPWMFGSQDDISNNFEVMLRMEKDIREGFMLFNSFYDLEGPVLDDYPAKGIELCPIGPLLPWHTMDGDSRSRSSDRPAALWAAEMECLDWLDKQDPGSVIYVSFGSLAMLNEKQFKELALGLEATGRSFLWVVHRDLMDGMTAIFPEGFMERVGDRGYLVSWAPQLLVLSHPSLACFITHCGWNSTVEGISTGVPMLCWPFFIDQFLDCSHIVNEWRIGIQLIANKEGIIEKEEIQNAVEILFVGEEGMEIKERATELKKKARAAVKEGGSLSLKDSKVIIKVIEIL